MSIIRLENVSKDYSLGRTTVHAVRGVTLDIAEREFVAVAGPSGSGKSTLLNLIATIDEPTAGHVLVRGSDTARLSDDQRTDLRSAVIGYVFQRFNLVPVLSALENVMLPLELQGVRRRDARARAMQMLSDVGLAEFGRQRPDQLSGGQQQRVAIARALVTRPALVVADEPTANLDSETAHHIVELMRTLNRQRSTTFIFSTHDDRLLDHVDRHLHLVDGQLAGDQLATNSSSRAENHAGETQ